MVNNPRSMATLVGSALSVVLLTACGSPSTGADTTPVPTVTTSSPASQSSPSSSPATTEPAEAAPAEITIKDFEYQVPESVAPGAQVTIVNEDGQNHTVTHKGGKVFDVKVTGRGGEVTFTAPMKPGTYPFFCTFHGNMTAVLVVR